MSAEVAIALIGVAGTVVGSLGASLLTNRAAAEREQRQWDREIRMQNRRELLEASEAFAGTAALAATGSMVDMGILVNTLARLQLRGSANIRQAADELYEAVWRARQAALKQDSANTEALYGEVRMRKNHLLKVVHDEV